MSDVRSPRSVVAIGIVVPFHPFGYLEASPGGLAHGVFGRDGAREVTGEIRLPISERDRVRDEMR